MEHILKEHGIILSEHLKNYPNDAGFLSFANPTLNLQFIDNKERFVTCAICGKKLSRLDWRHLSKHGVTQKDYILKYGNKTVCETTKDKLRKIAKVMNESATFHNVSKAEIEIKEFITNNGISVYDKRKIIDGKEIDIYLPYLKIGIEYNGIYYHTEQFKNGSDYHLQKTEVCERNGITLIQIFEDEYRNHKDVVYERLSNILGFKRNINVYKDLTVSLIDGNSCRRFLDENTFGCDSINGLSFGAFYGSTIDTIVGAMMVRELKDGKWEIVRIGSKIGYQYCGVEKRLFDWFISTQNPTLVSYRSDRRWETEIDRRLYKESGFVFNRYLKPDYRYVGKVLKRMYRMPKDRVTKQRLLKIDQNGVLNNDMPLKDMLYKLDIHKIYDCGYSKYVWKRPNC